MILEVNENFFVTGMADYQYQPDINDPVAKLRTAMDNMDGMTLCIF